MKSRPTPPVEPIIATIKSPDEDDHLQSFSRDITAPVLQFLQETLSKKPDGNTTLNELIRDLDVSTESDHFYYALSARQQPEAPNGFYVLCEEAIRSSLTGFFGLEDLEDPGDAVISMPMIHEITAAYENQLEREKVVFYMPAEQAISSFGEQANLAVILNAQDFERFNDIQKTVQGLGGDSLKVAPDTEQGTALAIDYFGITFDEKICPLYRATASIGANGQFEVEVFSGDGDDVVAGHFVSYDGLKLSHLERAYKKAVEAGVEHVTLDARNMTAYLTNQRPAIIDQKALIDLPGGVFVENQVGQPIDLEEPSAPASPGQKPGS